MAELIPESLPGHAHPFEHELVQVFKDIGTGWKVFPSFMVKQSDNPIYPREVGGRITCQK